MRTHTGLALLAALATTQLGASERPQQNHQKDISWYMSELALGCRNKEEATMTESTQQGTTQFPVHKYTLVFEDDGRDRISFTFIDGSVGHPPNQMIDPEDTILRQYGDVPMFCRVCACPQEIPPEEKRYLEGRKVFSCL